jgi:hypothetical protein
MKDSLSNHTNEPGNIFNKINTIEDQQIKQQQQLTKFDENISPTTIHQNQNEQETTDEINSLDEEYFFTTEKFTYNFDFPNQIQPGYVDIENNKVVLIFPEPSSTYVPKYPHTQSVQLFLNRQLVFSYSWLPIYSLNDFYRVKDMIAKGFQEYSNKTHRNEFMAPKTICSNAKQYEEMFTICETNKFYLSCLEDAYTSSITLDLKSTNSESNLMLNPMHCQIFIGSNLIFCTQRDLLPCLDPSMIHFVTQFILYKLLKV